MIMTDIENIIINAEILLYSKIYFQAFLNNLIFDKNFTWTKPELLLWDNKLLLSNNTKHKGKITFEILGLYGLNLLDL